MSTGGWVCSNSCWLKTPLGWEVLQIRLDQGAGHVGRQLGQLTPMPRPLALGKATPGGVVYSPSRPTWQSQHCSSLLSSTPGLL